MTFEYVNRGLKYNGALPDPEDPRDYKAEDYVAMGIRPDEYRAPDIISIKAQGAYNCCVGEALAAMASYFHYKETEMAREFSAEFIYHNRKHTQQATGPGMYVRYALSDFCDYGTVYLQYMAKRLEYTTSERQKEVASLLADAEPNSQCCQPNAIRH